MKYFIDLFFKKIIIYLIAAVCSLIIHFILLKTEYPILEVLLFLTILDYFLKNKSADILISFAKNYFSKNINFYFKTHEDFTRNISNSMSLNTIFIVLYCLEDRVQPIILTIFDIKHINTHLIFESLTLVSIYITAISVFEFIKYKKTFYYSTNL